LGAAHACAGTGAACQTWHLSALSSPTRGSSRSWQILSWSNAAHSARLRRSACGQATKQACHTDGNQRSQAVQACLASICVQSHQSLFRTPDLRPHRLTLEGSGATAPASLVRETRPLRGMCAVREQDRAAGRAGAPCRAGIPVHMSEDSPACLHPDRSHGARVRRLHTRSNHTSLN